MNYRQYTYNMSETQALIFVIFWILAMLSIVLITPAAVVGLIAGIMSPMVVGFWALAWSALLPVMVLIATAIISTFAAVFVVYLSED